MILLFKRLKYNADNAIRINKNGIATERMFHVEHYGLYAIFNRKKQLFRAKLHIKSFT